MKDSCLSSRSSLELGSQIFVKIKCSFVISKQEKVISYFSAINLIGSVGPFVLLSFEKVEKFIFSSVIIFITSTEPSKTILNVLSDLLSMIIHELFQLDVFILSQKTNWVRRLELILVFNHDSWVAAPIH